MTVKSNKYTQWIDKIKTPDDVMNRAIESIKKCESVKENKTILNSSNRQEKVIQKPLRKRIRNITAIALSFVFILSISMITINKSEQNTPFIITANAMELNTDTYVEVGRLQSVGSGGPWLQIGTDAEKQGYAENVELTKVFNMDITFKAYDAVSVAYSTTSGYFLVDTSYKGYIKSTGITVDDLESHALLVI